MRRPTEITDDETYWLRSRDVSNATAVAGDGYFDEHDVPRPGEVTPADLPPTEDAAVRFIDEEALERGKTIGKWQVTGSADRIDDLFPPLVADAETGTIWAAKAMTATGHAELPYDDYLVTVYTPNYFATPDVERVRDHLRDEHGVTHELYYKPDVYTAKGIVAETAGEFGLDRPARYVD